ncbi:MAG: polysaccharide deacetylase family protein [Kofleriaceae bacterium]|nr:polysaccharide deacetylase family protein [Kofleriaceae bacterium]
MAGGTRLTIQGSGFTDDVTVTVGGTRCDAIQIESDTELSCTTGEHQYIEGPADVIVASSSGESMLEGAFAYRCPWTTSGGRRTCGAAPAREPAAQIVDSWVTTFEDGHGFEAAGVGRSSESDTSDFVLGAQSAFVETEGAGAIRSISRSSMAPIDFTDRMPKIWIKVDNVEHVKSLDLVLGDSGFANSYTFKLASTQADKWTTDGDWVSFTIPWSSEIVKGTPHRDAITDVMLRIADDATGARVCLHVNGIALVREPVDLYPNGVISFTFDDGFASMVEPASTILAKRKFPATAYVIADMVDTGGRVRLDELHALDANGWDIAAHARFDANHAARYTKLTAAEVEDDMVDVRSWLMQQGFSGYDHCAYPGGAFATGPDILSLAHRYFTSCRTIYQRQHETLPVADGSKLRVQYVTNATPLATVKAAIDDAKTSREWVILVFHDLVDGTPTSSTEWRTSDFTAVVDHVAASGIPVLTVSEVLGH